MIEKKTAALLKMCCSVGAKIVTKEKKIINSLENFGKNLGMAFQLNDDLLDLMADEKRFGKVIGGDLIEGKKTFLLLTALQLAEGKDKNLLKKLLSNKVITEKDVLEFKELFLKLGVIKKTQREIKKYSIKATSQLEEIPGNKYVDVLQWLTEKLTKREN
jgi:geranylgeranyl pyrophosphate synthase